MQGTAKLGLDIIIEAARIHDGEKFLPETVRVGISGDSLVFPCPNDVIAARETIDASGLVLCPAFIDVHNHGDTRVLTHDGINLLAQGVGTVIVGNCGFSPWGDCGNHPVFLDEGCRYQFPTAADYFNALSEMGTLPNVFSFVGMQALLPVGGMLDRLDEALDAGCIGLSVGLNYEGQNVVGEDDLIALGKRLARRSDRWGGISWHMRDQGEHMLDSIREVIRVHEKTGVPCHINHLKRVGIEHPEDIEEALALIEPYPDLSVDMYPYVEGWTALSLLVSAGMGMLGSGASPGDAVLAVLRQFCPNLWDDVVVVSGVGPEYMGRSVTEIGRTRRLEPIDAYLAIISESPTATACYMNQSHPSNLEKVYKFDRSLVGSDGHVYSKGELGHHPRSFGTFPRFFSRCRDLRWMSIEKAIRKMTGDATKRFRLDGRGRILNGWKADLCLFDPARISDRATFADPNALAVGVERVFIGGRG